MPIIYFTPVLFIIFLVLLLRGNIDLQTFLIILLILVLCGGGYYGHANHLI